MQQRWSKLSQWSAPWLALTVACGASSSPPGPAPGAAPAGPETATSVPPTESPIQPSYVGEGQLKVLAAPLSSRVFAQGRWGEFRILALDLGTAADEFFPPHPSEPSSGWQGSVDRPTHVEARGAAYAFASLTDADELDQQPHALIWLLVPEARLAELDILLSVGQPSPSLDAGYQARVTVPQLGAETRDVHKLYGRALRRKLHSEELGVWGEYADQRLGKLFFEESAPASAAADAVSSYERARLMELGTGLSSVELALQKDVAFRTGAAFKATLPLSSLEAPRTRHHEWALMLQQLGVTVPPMEISRAAPRDFYFVHAVSAEALFAALDELERWGTPLAHLLEPSDYRYELAARYQTRLGLSRGPLTEQLGPTAIREVALVGSDPFLRQGSDVTVLFRAKNELLLHTGLAASLGTLEQEHGALSHTVEAFSGQQLHTTISADGAVHRYQVDIADYSILSTSKLALGCVLSTLAGQTPALADAPDFQYMRARDARVPADVLFYAGDAFIENAVSPRSRILDARRSLALHELRQFGFATVLGGAFGQPPGASAATLIQAGYLDKKALSHFDGQKIDFSGGVARSPWGTPAHMTPLIDLETPQRVSADEQAAYQSFAQNYERSWSEAIDPIALRLQLDRSAQKVRLHLRVLPVVSDRDYTEIQRLAGSAAVRPGAQGLGVRALFAIDPESSLRRELEGGSQVFLGQRISLDWVGSYAFAGLAEKPSLATALRSSFAPPEPSPVTRGASNGASRRDRERDLFHIPAYAGIEVKSHVMARLFLEFARREAQSKDILFEDDGTYEGATVTRVWLRDETDLPSLYYALGQRTLFLSLDRQVLEQLLSREAHGQEPETPADASREAHVGTTQMGVDLELRQGGALAAVLCWFDEDEKRHRQGSRPFASHAYRAWGWGAATPRAQISRTFLDQFGEQPRTPDGLSFALTDVGLADPARGLPLRPRWPALPVQGSDLERLLSALTQLRSGLSFDAEPPGTTPFQNSLRVELEFGTR